MGYDQVQSDFSKILLFYYQMYYNTSYTCKKREIFICKINYGCWASGLANCTNARDALQGVFGVLFCGNDLAEVLQKALGKSVAVDPWIMRFKITSQFHR